MHFAEMLDTETSLPDFSALVMQPFEPLLVMFERGGGFQMEGCSLIRVGLAGVPKGALASCKARAEFSLMPVALDALDAVDRP